MVTTQYGWGNGTEATYDYIGHIYGPGIVTLGAPSPEPPAEPTGLAIQHSANPVMFSWTRDLTASWYQVAVTTADGVALDAWYDASQVCDAVICRVTVNTVLDAAQHELWVGAWNDRGQTWNTTPLAFTVNPVLQR